MPENKEELRRPRSRVPGQFPLSRQIGIEFLGHDVNSPLMVNRRLFLACLWLACSCLVADAADIKVIKVLPHYLDQEGRHSLSPSLFERDAYQSFLRKNPDRRSGLRFDIQWKAKAVASSNLVLRVELRTSKGPQGKPLVVERPVHRSGWFSRWSDLMIVGEPYRNMGDMIAWRVGLWDGERLLSEQKSFLW
jgi:hypothetical protein